MNLLDQLAEQRIQEALARGEFTGLPGQGQPLELADDSLVAPELRTAYRLLKNAGCLPPELELRKQIRDLQDLLDGVRAGEEAPSRTLAQRRLQWLRLRLAHEGRSRTLTQSPYLEQVMQRLQGESDSEPQC